MTNENNQPGSVERLKQAIETLRCVRGDDLSEAGDMRSRWSVLVEAERLILVYANEVVGRDAWDELHAFLDGTVESEA